MAQIINSFSTDGLFKASAVEMTTVTQDTVSTDLRGEQGNVIAIIEMPSTLSGDFSLECQPNATIGEKPISVALNEKAINVIRFTTKGIKKQNGFGDFKIVAASGASINGAGIKICFIKHVAVINN